MKNIILCSFLLLTIATYAQSSKDGSIAGGGYAQGSIAGGGYAQGGIAGGGYAQGGIAGGGYAQGGIAGGGYAQGSIAGGWIDTNLASCKMEDDGKRITCPDGIYIKSSAVDDSIRSPNSKYLIPSKEGNKKPKGSSEQ